MDKKLVKLVKESTEEVEVLEEGATSDTMVLYFLGRLKKLQTKLSSTEDLNARLEIIGGMLIANASISVLNGKSSKKSILGKLKKMLSAVI